MKIHIPQSSAAIGLLKRSLGAFWNLHAPAIRRNVRFRDIHKGETCLIFGNGASLKYYDFTALPSDVPVISCTFGLIDRRMQGLNLKYHVISESYTMYPFVYNVYVDSFQRHPMSRVVKKEIAENPRVTFFLSVSNAWAFLLRRRNVAYWHHFGLKDFSSCDLAGKFATCSCALDVMLGIARYMGFSRALLFGCDYLCVPKMEGHFYSDRLPNFGEEDPEYVERIQKSIGDLDILVVTPKGVSSRVFRTVTFEEQFGAPEVYQTNREIIAEDDLELMREAARSGTIVV